MDVERNAKLVKALLYAVQVSYSFFIMYAPMLLYLWNSCNQKFCTDENRLLFMTYNGWVMLAVGVGAFLGYLAFGTQASPTKSVACH